MTPEEQEEFEAFQKLKKEQAAKKQGLDEFQQKLEALCGEYKVTLQVQQIIGIVPNAS